MFENARWITRTPWIKWGVSEAMEDIPPAPYLTKRFETGEKIRKANLCIIGLGQGAYYVNGERIPDSYLPTHLTDMQKRVVYNEYDITEMLVEGKNCLGVVLGNGNSNNPEVKRYRFTTQMLAQLDIEYESGKKECIVSDTSWKTADSPILFTLRRYGEKYDARLEIPGWCLPDFDDSKWDNAVIANGPGGAIESTVCPPYRIMEHIPGKEIAPGLFDFGINTCGWVHISVKGHRGSEIVLRYAEKLSEDGCHVDQSNMHLGNYKYMLHLDRYIPKSNEVEEYEQSFCYQGFRYAEIQGEYDSVEATAVVAHTDIAPLCEFECDNAMVNQIHNATMQSVLTNCHGTMVDCPQREQNEWTGDAMLSAEVIAMQFDSYNMFYETMLKYKDEQFPNGSLPCIVPMRDGIWEQNFANGPDWDSAIFHIPYYCFKYTGNPAIVDLMWENMNRSLKYFATLSENHLLSCGVGDWAPIGGMCNKEITDTAYYRIAALMMAEMAEATGRDSEEYVQLAGAIKKEFREKYILDGHMTDGCETAIAMSLYAKMYDGEEEQAEAQRLAMILERNEYQFRCGVHGLRTIFDVLSEHGYTEVLLKSVCNPDKQGYGHSMALGLSTLPEFFNHGASLNHHFKSQVDAWFFQYLAGIRFGGFGTGNIIIEPRFVSDIHELKASVRGISVHYNDEWLKVNSPYPFVLKINGKERVCEAGAYTMERAQM